MNRNYVKICHKNMKKGPPCPVTHRKAMQTICKCLSAQSCEILPLDIPGSEQDMFSYMKSLVPANLSITAYYSLFSGTLLFSEGKWVAGNNEKKCIFKSLTFSCPHFQTSASGPSLECSGSPEYVMMFQMMSVHY